MNYVSKPLYLVVGLLLMLPILASAQGYAAPATESRADVFIKFDGVDGESADSEDPSPTQNDVRQGEGEPTEAKGFLKIKGIEGEATDSGEPRTMEMTDDPVTDSRAGAQAADGHKDWIVIESMSSPASSQDTDDASGGDPDRPIITGNVANPERIKKSDLLRELIDAGSLVGLNPQPEPPSADLASDKKTGDIVIKGSKIHENAPVRALLENAVISPNGVETDEDLGIYAAAVAASDSSLQEITLGRAASVEVEFSRPAKLFGLFNSRLAQRVKTGPCEEKSSCWIRVSTPWYGFLYTERISNEDFKKEIEANLPEAHNTDDRPTEEVSFYYNKIQVAYTEAIRIGSQRALEALGSIVQN